MIIIGSGKYFEQFSPYCTIIICYCNDSIRSCPGTFIARQPQFVACGYATASLSMVLKFLVGPVVMLLASLARSLSGYMALFCTLLLYR
jgi:hypothetical protein